MKKFIEEFKAFALRGNVMDMAIGVIIGGAFTSIVTSLTENLINPILGLFGGTDLSGFVLNLGGVELRYGAFITSIIELFDHGVRAVLSAQSGQQADCARQKAGSTRRADHQGLPVLLQRDSDQGCQVCTLRFRSAERIMESGE